MYPTSAPAPAGEARLFATALHSGPSRAPPPPPLPAPARLDGLRGQAAGPCAAGGCGGGGGGGASPEGPRAVEVGGTMRP